MAQETRIVLDFTDPSNYMEFISSLRRNAADPNRFCGNVPVLPPPPDPQQVQYITLELRAAGQQVPLIVRIRRHDLYLVGYQMQNGQWLEFQNRHNIHYIEGSEYLPFGENYNDLYGLTAGSFNIGYNVLTNAILNLRNTNDNVQRGRSLRILCVMICEAARSSKLSATFDDWIRSLNDRPFEGWMGTLIRSWGSLSRRLLMRDLNGTQFDITPGPNATANPLTAYPEINIHSAEDALNSLSLLCGSYTGSSSVITMLDAATLIAGVGSPMVELFSIQINDIDGENPGDLYGSIEVIDDWGSFYMYNRSRGDYESIYPGEIASLVGPYRAISISQSFTVLFDLKDKDSDLSPDDEVSKGYVAWDIYYLNSTWDDYNKPLSTVVEGKYGRATMHYAILLEAWEATIEVILDNGDGEDPADVCGSIVARFNDEFYEHADPNLKQFYQTTLFNKSANNNIHVRPGEAIPLSRSIVAVPLNFSLIVEAHLKDYDYFSPNDDIANGTAEFVPLPNMSSQQEIFGKYGKITVRVAWTPVSGGLLS